MKVHTFGILCSLCDAELESDWCDECRFLRSHGWITQEPAMWPDHECS